MSTAGLIDLPQDIFSGEAPFIPAEDLPPGASAGCQDVQFQMGMWATRQGLKSVFNPLTNSPSVNGLASFVNPAPPPIGFVSNPLMVFDALGNLYQEGEPGTLAVVKLGAAKPALFLLSALAFERMYMAFGDGIAGQDIPRQFDGTNLDRVTQQGAGAAPSVADSTATQAIAASGVPGLHQVSFTGCNISEVGNVVSIDVHSGTPAGTDDVFYVDQLQVGDAITIPTSTVAAYEGSWILSSVQYSAGSPSIIQFLHPTSGLASGTGTIETGLALVTATTAIAPPAAGASPSFVPGSTLTIAGAGVTGYDGTWSVRETGYVADQFFGTFILTQEQAIIAMPTRGLGDSGGGTIVIPGGISAGVHQLSVIFVTRQGAELTPPFPVSWTAAGSRQANITDIPTGPANIVQRILCLTAANAGNFFYIPNSAMVINDNTTTNVTLDFTDTLLLSATNVDELFNVVELGECDSVTPYALRNFWIGERNKMNNWVNTGFDGGWDLGGGTGGADLPLGWTSDPSFGGGGKRQESINPGGTVWGDAYAIVADGITSDRGMIEQPGVSDQYGQPRFTSNAGYSVRARVARSANLAAGTFRINAFSPSAGEFAPGGIAVTAQQATTAYQEFIAEIILPPVPNEAAIPADTVLRIYADGTPIPSGEYFLVDCVEIFPTEQPYNTTLVRASKALLPEQFDGETGIMSVPTPENDTLTASFKLREKFYICGTHCLFVTEDNGSTEPSGWSLQEVSNTVGACSGRAVGIGEEWVILACRTGVYILWAGAEPVKISQEIQPVWDAINWAAAATVWVVVDTRAKRVAIGVPMGSATAPNQVLYMDYQGLDTAADIASYHSVRYSPYSGKILTIGDARKWSPWSIQANSCALVERADGTQHLFFGSSNASGKIYDLLDGQYTDDGAAIPWSYSTHMIPAVIERQMMKLGSGRLLFGYLKGYVEGSGQMAISYQPVGNAAPIQLPPLTLVDPSAVPVAITSAVRKNGITTVTCSAPHGLQNGVDVQANLIGVADVTFNGTFALQVVKNPQQLTVYQPGLPDATSTGGGVGRVARPFEFTTNVTAERVVITFSNYGNTPGTWARMKALVPYVAPSPWATERGTVN